VTQLGRKKAITHERSGRDDMGGVRGVARRGCRVRGVARRGIEMGGVRGVVRRCGVRGVVRW
jgi:hypothetical protein